MLKYLGTLCLLGVCFVVPSLAKANYFKASMGTKYLCHDEISEGMISKDGTKSIQGNKNEVFTITIIDSTTLSVEYMSSDLKQVLKLTDGQDIYLDGGKFNALVTIFKITPTAFNADRTIREIQVTKQMLQSGGIWGSIHNCKIL